MKPYVKKIGRFYYVMVPSPTSETGYIPQGEYKTKRAAEADLKQFEVRANPMAYVKGRTTKKKTGRKKKRTAAQKRATANLVKLNKQRAKKKVAKKRPTKKRTAKKKTTARKRNPVSNYKVFRIRGKGDLAWLTLRGPKLGWTLTSGDAIIFAHKSQASEAAHKAARHFGGTWVYGVAPTGKSISAIVSEFEKQTGKK